MAHVFYADKKSIHKSKIKSKEKIREKKVDQSWSASLSGLFKVIKWIGENRIYRPFAHLPLPILNGLGHLIGHFGIGTSKSVQRKTQASLRMLHPNYSEQLIKKLSNASSKFLGEIFVDIVFRLLYATDHPSPKFVDSGNFNVLEDAFTKAKDLGTGVIVPTLHLGEYFHVPLVISRHPKKYAIDTIASMSNMAMWEAGNRSEYTNIYIYASTSFSKLSPFLEKNMRKHHILLTYHDYSSPTQLRVPFIYGKFPYLIHTVQSYISLHRKTGAIIVPAIALPKGIFGRSQIKFLKNDKIMQTSEKYWNASNKVFHGELSTEINRTLYPYIVSYSHMWEEIMRFSALRTADKLEFPAGCTIYSFLHQIHNKMISILENSYEPNRLDVVLKTKIEAHFPQIISAVLNPKLVVRTHKTKIMLSALNAISELQKLCYVALKELKLKKELVACQLIQNLADSLAM